MYDGKFAVCPARNPLFRICFLAFALVGALCGCVVAFEVWNEIESRKEFEDKIRDIDQRSECEVTAVGEFEERLADETGRCDADAALCRSEARSSVVVRYAVAGETAARVSTAWSSVDGSWEDGGDSVATEFLDRFGVLGSSWPCWYNAAVPDSVRLWDERYDHAEGAQFWVPVGFFVFCVVSVVLFTVDRYHTALLGGLRSVFPCCFRAEEEANDEEMRGMSPKAPFHIHAVDSPPPARRMSDAERAAIGLPARRTSTWSRTPPAPALIPPDSAAAAAPPPAPGEPLSARIGHGQRPRRQSVVRLVTPAEPPLRPPRRYSQPPQRRDSLPAQRSRSGLARLGSASSGMGRGRQQEPHTDV
eukprot:TRINITY_DN39679_c0_g1_i1.p1 TRINITY_DN39679_c0_g1~~TRINITY_DN39679_c0_g1_i1.p1  ORF type:complete len:361 (+),score=52.08 TRINITY_DN39679_c0_g1_i1:54-1136(+)